ncbi:hypothetical protein [Pimelobacter simplex]|uniref:hypothetical protein n=1 Tax=Nocardioides simplex TaxID=2045 RepID=UPI003AAF9C8B
MATKALHAGLVRIGIAAILVGAMLWHSAPAAQAVTYEYKVAVDADRNWWDCKGKDTVLTGGVRVCFAPNGDWFYVTDELRDGKSAGVVWRNPASGRRGICRNQSGNGSPLFCDYNFPENTTIHYYAAKCNGNTRDCRLVDSWVTDSDELSRSTS